MKYIILLLFVLCFSQTSAQKKIFYPVGSYPQFSNSGGGGSCTCPEIEFDTVTTTEVRQTFLRISPLANANVTPDIPINYSVEFDQIGISISPTGLITLPATVDDQTYTITYDARLQTSNLRTNINVIWKTSTNGIVQVNNGTNYARNAQGHSSTGLRGNLWERNGGDRSLNVQREANAGTVALQGGFVMISVNIQKQTLAPK